MDRKANIINSPMLNFNCLPTLASEVTTCFRCTLAFIRQLKLSDSPICEHNNFLHIHMTLLSITAETVAPSLVVVLPGIWCGALSYPGLKGAIISSSAHILIYLLFCFVFFKPELVFIYFADTDSIILSLCRKMSEGHMARKKTGGSFYRPVITNHQIPLSAVFEGA